MLTEEEVASRRELMLMVDDTVGLGWERVEAAGIEVGDSAPAEGNGRSSKSWVEEGRAGVSAR